MDGEGWGGKRLEKHARKARKRRQRRGRKKMEITEMKEGEIKGGKARLRKGEDAVKSNWGLAFLQICSSHPQTVGLAFNVNC